MSTAKMRKCVVRVASPRAGHSHNQKELKKNGAARVLAAAMLTEWGLEHGPQSQAKRIMARNTGP
jgi:hypothetical protein